MDTSETYIKMCEKAEEIQSQRIRNPQPNGSQSLNIYDDWEGCYYAVKSEIHKDLGGGINYDIYLYTHRPAAEFFDEGWMGDAIWLPRQDQLQEMVDLGGGAKELALFFGWFCSPKESFHQTVYVAKFKTMEQLWLAFVMKEKYNKIWDGEGWVKGTS